jgi:hypothetical protein
MQMAMIRIKTLMKSESGLLSQGRRNLVVENLVIVGGKLMQAKVNKEERPILINLIARVHAFSPSGLQSVPLYDVDGVAMNDLFDVAFDVALKGREEESNFYPSKQSKGEQRNHAPLNEFSYESPLVHHFATLSKNLW